MAGEAWRMGGGRSCDTCQSSAAAVYCRAEVAYRCGECDARAHGAGARHERVWVCEVCESAPAAVTCRADAAALCAACDADIHSANPLAHRHERLPVAPLPAAEPAKDDGQAEAATWLLPNLSYKGLMDAPELKLAAEFFFQDVDPYLDMEYASSMDVRCDGVVPVQVKAAPDGGGGGGVAAPAATLDGCVELNFAKASYCSYSYNGHSEQVTSSEVGVVPDGGSWAADASNTCGVKAVASVGTDREARVMRYREKRKNRRFEKTIRYASRKAYAETRPRIKGRFVKRADAPPRSLGDAAAASAAASFVAGVGYGVVPSY